MNKLVLSLVVVLAILCVNESFADTPQFEKISDHCYYLRFEESEANAVVVVSEEGILLVDPPQEQNLFLVINALGRISPKTVRWMAFTNPRFFRTAGTRYFAKRGALLLASQSLQAIVESGTETVSKYPEILREWIRHIAFEEETASYHWVIFDNEMRLFASDLEIRIMAIQHKARTGGDVVVHVPDEKVLIVGDLYESARYPDIDTASKGSPLEWIDGVEQVINSVPLLKSAIPEEGSESEEEEEKTLEERITVVSSQGEVSNLQNMKDLLEACQRLQRYVVRAVDRGRSFERFLTLSATGPYFSYGNLESYAAQLYEALKTSAEKKQ